MRYVMLYFAMLTLSVACGEASSSSWCDMESFARQPEHALACYLARPEPQQLTLVAAHTSPKGSVYRFAGESGLASAGRL